MIRQTWTYFLIRLKGFINPIYTIFKYPHVQLHGRVIIKNCKIRKEVKVFDNTIIADSTIGEYSYVGENCKITNSTIGRFCSIGPNVRIGVGIHPTDRVSTYPGFYSLKAGGVYRFFLDPKIIEKKRIVIENDIWIGFGATIIDGVSLGNGSIIGAGSLVTKDVPPYAIVGGVPAKIIRFRFEQSIIDSLVMSEWWNFDIERLRSLAPYMSDPEQFINKL